MTEPTGPEVKRPAPFVVDLESLTLLDVMDLEEELGMSLVQVKEKINSDSVGQGKMLAHMVWFMMRHDEPEITLREAAARVTIASLQDVDMPGKAEGGNTSPESPASRLDTDSTPMDSSESP